MRWNWRSILLVAVLSICVIILIAPDVDLQQSALRALQWMQIFFALITGLATLLCFVSGADFLAFMPAQPGPHALPPLHGVLSLRC
jgi:hypothetical protein